MDQDPTIYGNPHSVNVNKTTGPDNIPALVLRNHANVPAPPLSAERIRQGVFPMEWNMVNLMPLPKPVSIGKKHIIPIAAQVFESIIIRMVDEAVEGEIDAKQIL